MFVFCTRNIYTYYFCSLCILLFLPPVLFHISPTWCSVSIIFHVCPVPFIYCYVISAFFFCLFYLSRRKIACIFYAAFSKCLIKQTWYCWFSSIVKLNPASIRTLLASGHLNKVSFQGTIFIILLLFSAYCPFYSKCILSPNVDWFANKGVTRNLENISVWSTSICVSSF